MKVQRLFSSAAAATAQVEAEEDGRDSCEDPSFDRH